MSDTVLDLEIVRLARLLRVPAERLGYLNEVDPGRIRQVRIAMEDRIVEHNAHGLARVSVTAKVLPSSVVATITERNGSPILTARLAAVLDSGRAADIARKLSPTYMSRVAAYLGERHAGEIVGKIPVKALVSTCRQLVDKADWVTLGTIVSSVSTENRAELTRQLGDEAVGRVERAGFAVESS